MLAPNEVVHRDPEILSGELVFVGTRVPVRNLRPLIPKILDQLATIKPGQVVTIGG